MMSGGGDGGGDYVQLNEFGTVVIFFVNVHVKFFFVNNRAFQSHRSNSCTVS